MALTYIIATFYMSNKSNCSSNFLSNFSYMTTCNRAILKFISLNRMKPKLKQMVFVTAAENLKRSLYLKHLWDMKDSKIFTSVRPLWRKGENAPDFFCCCVTKFVFYLYSLRNDYTEFSLDVFIVKIFRDISEEKLVMVSVLRQGWKIPLTNKELNTHTIEWF